VTTKPDKNSTEYGDKESNRSEAPANFNKQSQTTNDGTESNEHDETTKDHILEFYGDSGTATDYGDDHNNDHEDEQSFEHNSNQVGILRGITYLKYLSKPSDNTPKRSTFHHMAEKKLREQFPLAPHKPQSFTRSSQANIRHYRVGYVTRSEKLRLSPA